MSGRNRACDSSFRRTITGQRPASSQVWANENSPPEPSKTQRYADTCRRRFSAPFRPPRHRMAMPCRLWLAAN